MRRKIVVPAEFQRRTRIRRTEVFPSGPGTLEEAMDWPRSIIDALLQGADGSADESLLMRVQMNLRQRNVVVTDYSGWDCPQWCFHAMIAAFRNHLQWEPSMLSEAFNFARACDFGPVQNRVLTAISHQHHKSSMCVHANMIHRLPRKARRHIERELPPPDASVDTRRDAYSAIALWLLENRQWVFPADAKAECSTHGKQCFANGIMWVPEDQRESPDRPSIWNISGLTCHAWSAEGKGEGLAHESALYHGIWHAERIALAEASQEDGFFFECTPLFPVRELIRDRFAKTHFCFWVIVDPLWQGYPSRRRRVLCFCGNRKTLVWTGAETNELFMQDFHRRFSRTVVLAGSSLMCDTESNRWAAYRDIAMRRGHDLTVQELEDMPVDDMTDLIGPPGFGQRLAEWSSFHQANVGAPGFMADCDHHPVVGRNAGGMTWPVQLTHGTIVCFGGGGPHDWRMATAKEHMVAQGFHAVPAASSSLHPVCPLADILDQLQVSSKDVKKLSGNGMSLITQSSFMMCIFANVVRRDSVGASVEEGITADLPADDWG